MSTRLVTIEKSRIELHVATVARQIPELVAAYLFGSALGPCRPDSDIDLGIILRPGEGTRADDRLEALLDRMDGHPFHVSLLRVESAFAFHVVQSGHVVYSADEVRRLDFLFHCALQHFYDLPHYASALDALRERVGF